MAIKTCFTTNIAFYLFFCSSFVTAQNPQLSIKTDSSQINLQIKQPDKSISAFDIFKISSLFGIVAAGVLIEEKHAKMLTVCGLYSNIWAVYLCKSPKENKRTSLTTKISMVAGAYAGGYLSYEIMNNWNKIHKSAKKDLAGPALYPLAVLGIFFLPPLGSGMGAVLTSYGKEQAQTNNLEVFPYFELSSRKQSVGFVMAFK